MRWTKVASERKAFLLNGEEYDLDHMKDYSKISRTLTHSRSFTQYFKRGKAEIFHDNKVKAIAMFENCIASGGKDNKVVLRELNSGNVLHNFTCDDEVNSIALCENYLAVGGKDNRVILRECESGQVLHEFNHMNSVSVF